MPYKRFKKSNAILYMRKITKRLYGRNGKLLRALLKNQT